MPSGFVVLEPDNCFALFRDYCMHFTRNNNVNTLFSNPEIPGFGLS